MAFDFGAAQWKSFDMPCPLLAAAISAAGNLAGAYMRTPQVKLKASRGAPVTFRIPSQSEAK
jgi:hypothetical protein